MLYLLVTVLYIFFCNLYFSNNFLKNNNNKKKKEKKIESIQIFSLIIILTDLALKLNTGIYCYGELKLDRKTILT